MKDNMLLVSLDKLQLLCLNFNCLQQINASLSAFRQQCIHHGLRASTHHAPLVIWQSNMIPLTDDSPLVNLNEYGIDYDGPAPYSMSKKVLSERPALTSELTDAADRGDIISESFRANSE